MKLGFIGAGEMGGAILRGLLSHGIAKEDILVSVRTPESATRLSSALGIASFTDNRHVIAACDWLFVAVKPGQVPSVLAEIAASHTPAKPLISMALGWTVKKIQQVLPAWPVVRIMPNTPLAIAEGITLVNFAPETPQQVRREVKNLFDKLGKTVEIALPVFEAATALSGSGPAFVYAFIDALTRAGVAQGMEENLAAQLAVQTVIGAARLAAHENISACELARKVATPGGCTAAGMDVLNASDFQTLLTRTLAATTQKAKEKAQ